MHCVAPFFEFTPLAPLVALFPLSTYFGSCCSLINLIIYRYVKFETSSMKSMIKLNTEVFQYFNILFLTYLNEKAYQEVPKNNVIFSIFFNFHEFFRLLSDFSHKNCCTVKCNHVLCIIRFLIKFDIGMHMSRRWGPLGENGFITKTIYGGYSF